jgi:hypothetical protein
MRHGDQEIGAFSWCLLMVGWGLKCTGIWGLGGALLFAWVVPQGLPRIFYVSFLEVVFGMSAGGGQTLDLKEPTH